MSTTSCISIVPQFDKFSTTVFLPINKAFGLLLTALIGSLEMVQTSYVPPYMTLPPAPGLPESACTGYINLSNGFDIWYAQFGTQLQETLANNKTPVLFLHGAHASSDYWGQQIKHLICGHTKTTVFVMDSRMQGRSGYGDMTTSFAAKADDVVGVLDHLGIPKARIVGWSNGAVILVNMLMTHPERIERAFVFGGWYDAVTSINQTSDSVQWNATGAVYFERTLGEMLDLSIEPGKVPEARQKYYEEFLREPHWDGNDFSGIKIVGLDKPLVWFVEGAEEEVVNKGSARQMQEWTPGSKLVVLQGVSHFAMFQNPALFNVVLGQFLWE